MFELNPRSVESENNSFRGLVFHYLKYWYIFAVGILLCVGATFLYIRYKTVPQYMITSTILVKDKDKGASVNAGEAIGNLGLVKPSSNIDDQIGILSSSSLMEKVVEELALNVNYMIQGQVRDVTVYWQSLPFYVLVDSKEQPIAMPPFVIQAKDSLSFNLSVNGSENNELNGTYQYGDVLTFGDGQFQVMKNLAYTQPVKDSGPVTVSFMDTKNLAAAYSSLLEIETANSTGSLLVINFYDAIPDRGKDIVHSLIEIYAEESVKYQNQLAISTIEIIDERLKLLTGEITDVEKDIAQYKQDNVLTNISSDAAIYLQNARESNKKLEEYQTQIEILNSLESYIQQIGDERLVPSSLNIQDPTLSSLISQYNGQQLEKKSLLRSTPEDNPLVVNISRSLDDLRTDILENLKNIKNSLEIAQNNVRQNSYKSQAQIAKVPTAERALLSINRDQGIKQELYLYLLQKREEEALSLEAPISNTRIVDPPKAGNFPVSPNKTSMYIGALIMGLFLPFTLVFLKDQLNDKVTKIEDIEKITTAPILGEISSNEKGANVVVDENDNTTIAELFRLMRFNLTYQTAGRPNKVILVTSGMQGEGKTFFTINLGASLALAGHTVVCLSFDLRAPQLFQKLKMKGKKGITDYIVDNTVTVKEITVEYAGSDGLHLMDSGPIFPNAGELMTHPRIGTLIEELKANYDYVLIDSAPVGKVADAYGLAPYIDATVFMVRQNYSSKTELRILEDIYKTQKLKYPMVVLNDTNTVKNYGYGQSNYK